MKTSCKTRDKTRTSTLTTSILYCIGSSSHGSYERKIKKKHPDWKERSKATPITCLQTNTKYSVNEIRKTIIFTITSKNT